MAALRQLGVTVPSTVEYSTQLTFFVPEGLELPFETWEIDDFLSADAPLPGNEHVPLPTDDQTTTAFEAGTKMLLWARRNFEA